MPQNSLSPAFVRLEYQSSFGTHTQTIPSVPVVEDVLAPTGWEFDLRGLALSVDVGQAVVDFVDLIKNLHHPTTIFTNYTIFAQSDPLLPATPVYSASLAIAGTFANSAWRKATQATVTWRADDFTLFKLVWLDIPVSNFDRIPSAFGVNSDLVAIDAYVRAPETWVASRGGGRPNAFLQWSTTLNEKLRRTYGMN